MSPSDQPFKSLRRHEDYHLTGGDIYFLVEQIQFRVHRYFFERESLFFQAKLCTPASPGSTKQGTSESTAILLDDVKAESFARFLWVFYNSKYSLYDASVEDWTAILDLAHRWTFPEVKKLCVRELEKLEMDDINRIVAYHKYDVDRTLLIPRYAALCQREHTLTLEEGLSLGMETTLNIVRARECARAKPSLDGLRSPAPPDIDDREMKSLIKDLFGITESQTEPVPAPPVNGAAVTSTTNGTTNGTNGTVTPVTKPAEPNAASKDPKPDTVKANGSDTTKANGDASKTNDDANGDAAKAASGNGDAAKPNGDTAAPTIDTGLGLDFSATATPEERPSTPSSGGGVFNFGRNKGGKGNKKGSN